MEEQNADEIRGKSISHRVVLYTKQKSMSMRDHNPCKNDSPQKPYQTQAQLNENKLIISLEFTHDELA
jgi:hypothetical protein